MLVVDKLDANVAHVVASVKDQALTHQIAELFKSYQFLSECQKDATILSQARLKLAAAFWNTLEGSFTTALALLKLSPHNVCKVTPLMDELESYLQFLRDCPIYGDQNGFVDVRAKASGLVQSYVDTIISQAPNSHQFTEMPATQDLNEAWKSLAPADWRKIWGSILLVGADPNFYTPFGREKLVMEELLHQARLGTSSCPTCQSPHCVVPYAPGRLRLCKACRTIPLFKPAGANTKISHCLRCRGDLHENSRVCKRNECGSTHQQLNASIYLCLSCDIHQTSSHCSRRANYYLPPFGYTTVLVGKEIVVPKSIAEDPEHFGHLPWRFCQIMKSLENGIATAKNTDSSCSITPLLRSALKANVTSRDWSCAGSGPNVETKCTG
jgi:hypothetical protein